MDFCAESLLNSLHTISQNAMLSNCVIPTPGYASHPARPQAFEHYSHTSGYEHRHGRSSYDGYKVSETDDDDWAKNPAARRQM